MRFAVRNILHHVRISVKVTKSVQRLRTIILYQYLELQSLLIIRSFSNKLLLLPTGSSKIISLIFIDELFHSPVLAIIEKHIAAITSQSGLKEDTKPHLEHVLKQSLLRQILNGTPKMLTDLEIIPHNENIIRNAAYNALVHVFPDTVKEESISKVTKTFKPDIGIRSLKTAIEYKFVDLMEEAKKAIGGIFEDIGGYGGSEDWKIFYAVIYMTDNFLTQDQIDSELKIAKAPSNWKLITLYGKGQRR